MRQGVFVLANLVHYLLLTNPLHDLIHELLYWLIALSGKPVFRQPGYTVGVNSIHGAVFVQLHQYLRILGIDIQDILDQLIVFFLAGSLDHGGQIRLRPADFLRYREQDAALVLAVMFFGVGGVAVACVVGAFALAVFLVIVTSVSVISGVAISVAGVVF